MMRYESPVDICYFGKPEDLDDSELQLITNLLNGPISNEQLLIKYFANIFYGLGFNIKTNNINFEGNSKFISATIRINQLIETKTVAEILKINKTEEELCLLMFYYYKKNFMGVVCEIRKQITIDNAIVRTIDFILRCTTFYNFPKNEALVKLEEVTKQYEAMYAADSLLKIFDNDMQKPKEMVLYLLVETNYKYAINISYNSENKFLITKFAMEYYDFIHRDEKQRKVMENYSLVLRNDHVQYLTDQMKILKNNRLNACLLDIINFWDYHSPRNELVVLIYENFDMVVKLSKIPMGCSLLIKIILELKKENYYPVKLLVCRLVRLTSGYIINLLYKRHKFVVKIYCTGMKTEDCPICFEKLKEGRVRVVECRTCFGIICESCFKLMNRTICPICCSTTSNNVHLNDILNLIVPDFKYELPAPKN